MLSNNSWPATLPNRAAVGALKVAGFLFVDQGFKFSIWLGKPLDPRRFPKFTTDRKNRDPPDDPDAPKQPTPDPKTPERTISARVGSDTLQNHFVCPKNRPATGRSWCFVEMSKLSVRWSQILTHWSLSRKATVSQQQRFPTTASQPHCQTVRLLEQGFKFSIWLGRSLDPKHSPWCKFTTDRKNCDFSDDLDASKQPKSDLKIPKRTISTRVASNTLETTSMWNTSTKNGSFWESFERINLNIKNRYVSGQKPLNRRFQYQPLQHREGRWCIFIYKERSFLLGLFLCLFWQKLFVAQNTVRLLRMCSIQFEVEGKKAY